MLNKYVLLQSAITSYSGAINDVSDDFLYKMSEVIGRTSKDNTTLNLAPMLFNWSLEGGSSNIKGILFPSFYIDLLFMKVP